MKERKMTIRVQSPHAPIFPGPDHERDVQREPRNVACSFSNASMCGTNPGAYIRGSPQWHGVRDTKHETTNNCTCIFHLQFRIRVSRVVGEMKYERGNVGGVIIMSVHGFLPPLGLSGFRNLSDFLIIKYLSCYFQCLDEAAGRCTLADSMFSSLLPLAMFSP
jgi:hypothetical protein